jgi:hypothetical protein
MIITIIFFRIYKVSILKDSLKKIYYAKIEKKNT